MIRAVLSIGANMDRARDNLTGVQAFFADELVAASKIYATPPWGGVEQGDFLNAVLIVDVDESPKELLRRGQKLEEAAERVRVRHWGPRTLDVDIVDIEGYTSDDPELTVPHPYAHERAFVLIPWLAADGGARLSGEGVAKRVAALDPKERADIRRLGMMEEL